MSVNRGWAILEAVRQREPEERDAVAAEMVAAVQDLDQMDAEIDRKSKIVSLFCKGYEKAVLLTPTPGNVRCWTECTRMTPDEIADSVRESYELAQTFQTIGDILKNDILPSDWRVTAVSEKG